MARASSESCTSSAWSGTGTSLSLSSANLTKYAFSLNMELGVLINGGSGPRQIEVVFESLIADGTLSRVHTGDV